MTPSELRSIGERVFGHGWQTRLAEHLEVSARTVRRWAAGEPIPAGAAEEIRSLVRIAPPAGDLSEDERDEACRKALGPHLAEFSGRAVAAGWHPAEIVTVMVGWALTQTIDNAGYEAARDLIHEAMQAIDADERGTS